jgi:hypothetical protein
MRVSERGRCSGSELPFCYPLVAAQCGPPGLLKGRGAVSVVPPAQASSRAHGPDEVAEPGRLYSDDVGAERDLFD